MKITMEPYTRYDSCLKPTFTFVEIWSGHFLYFNLHYHKHTQDEKSFTYLGFDGLHGRSFGSGTGCSSKQNHRNRSNRQPGDGSFRCTHQPHRRPCDRLDRIR